MKKKEKDTGSFVASKETENAIREAFIDCSSTYEVDRTGTAYRTPLFDFVRRCRAIQELADLKPSEALAVVTEVMRRNGLSFSQFENLEDDEGDVEFIDTWLSVIIPDGSDVIKEAMRKAEAVQESLTFPADTPPLMVKFLTFALCMQELTKKQSVALPVDRLSKEFGVSAMTISRLRKIAAHQGWIALAQAHNHKYKRAALYRINFSVSQRQMTEEACPF